MHAFKLILIGGTSHVGKSTHGRQADDLGWDYLSTDQLARHPGRPWREDHAQLPDDVVQHYTDLSAQDLVESVLSHYRQNVWPIIDAIIHSRLNNPFERGLIFEGSAMLPDLVAAAEYPRVKSVWLTAPEPVISERILHSSGYHHRPEAERCLIEAFLNRSILINSMLSAEVESHGCKLLDASAADTSAILRSLVSTDEV